MGRRKWKEGSGGKKKYCKMNNMRNEKPSGNYDKSTRHPSKFKEVCWNLVQTTCTSFNVFQTIQVGGSTRKIGVPNIQIAGPKQKSWRKQTRSQNGDRLAKLFIQHFLFKYKEKGFQLVFSFVNDLKDTVVSPIGN